MIGVDVVSLQYVYCHHYDSSSFFRHDTIFSVARSMRDICLLFIFQSISCRHIMLSSCSPVQIYILLLSRKISSLQNRSLIYSAVVLMDTIEFMYDSYNFLNNWSTCITYLSSTFPFQVLLFLQYIYLTLCISFSYDVLLHVLCMNLVHNLILVYHFVHIL